MPHEFKMLRRVEFAETDMAGILHFSNFFRYMEEVEHAFFRSLGLRVHARSDSEVLGWVRANAECTYHRPLRYEDVAELHLRVLEKRARSITYEVVFRKRSRADDADADLIEIARGRMSVVCVAKPEGGDRLRAIPIPREVDALIEEAPPETWREA